MAPDDKAEPLRERQPSPLGGGVSIVKTAIAHERASLFRGRGGHFV
jgi:hypothetical protein